VIVAKGLTGSFFMTAAGAQFFIIGPFPGGGVVRRVEFAYRSDGAQVYSFGLSVGGSARSGAAAFRAGTSLVDAGITTTEGVPAIQGITVAAETQRFTFFPGIEVARGSAFLQVMLNQGFALQSLLWVSAQIVFRNIKDVAV